MDKSNKTLSHEAKVGILFISSLVLILGLAYLLSNYKPFATNYDLAILYQFAGGVELGSPVRVSGIKVGKVKKISFLNASESEVLPAGGIRITLAVDKNAKESIRKDSQFFINAAGIIGERYIDITPGSFTQPAVGPGGVVRGIDPPRFDQLLSQGYGFFGDLREVLSTPDMRKFIKNATLISEDIRHLTKSMRALNDNKDLAKRMDVILKRLDTLTQRLETVDAETLRKFLSEGNIKVRAKVDLF